LQIVDLYLRAGLQGIVVSSSILQLGVILIVMTANNKILFATNNNAFLMLSYIFIIQSFLISIKLLFQEVKLRNILIISTIMNGMLYILSDSNNVYNTVYFTVYGITLILIMYRKLEKEIKDLNILEVLLLGGIPPFVTSYKYILVASSLHSFSS